MDLGHPRMMSHSPHQNTSTFAKGCIRFKWRWWRWTGWDIEGPFPQWKDRSVLLLGPGLDVDSAAVDFIRMRMGFHAQWLDCHSAPPPSGCSLLPYSAEVLDLEKALEYARRHSLPIHLVQLDRRHRKIRCNTPVQVGPFADRVRAYVERIFSYSADDQNVIAAFRNR